MIINKYNLDSIDNLYIHDMELKDIKVDYFGHCIYIFMMGQQHNQQILQFESVQIFSIDIFEPWGEGIYLSEIKANSSPDELNSMDYKSIVSEKAFMTEILINSGDKIKILAEKILFE